MQNSISQKRSVIRPHDIREDMADGAWKYGALALRVKGPTSNVNGVLIAF
jgi:hypothetical protein